jgi:Protein of unknown function (DUF3105)
LAKDRTPDGGRAKGGARGGSGRGGSSAARGNAGRGGADRGRTRPQGNVVTQDRRPWGLIAAAVAVVVFAAAVITYAVIAVQRDEANEVASVDEIDGIENFDYAAGQSHVAEPVDYDQSPPVGGPHDPSWADCTGTVYDVDVRHENAVHALEHGAVWITYDPEALSDDEVARLAELVDGESGRMLSPYEGLDSPISLQSWNHQLKVDSVDDPRIEQFADFLTYRTGEYPEPGASCENPVFAASPLVAGDASQSIGEEMPTDAPTTDEPTQSETSESPSS